MLLKALQLGVATLISCACASAESPTVVLGDIGAVVGTRTRRLVLTLSWASHMSSRLLGHCGGVCLYLSRVTLLALFTLRLGALVAYKFLLALAQHSYVFV